MNDSSPENAAALKLVVPRIEAEERLAERIDAGQRLQQAAVRSDEDLERARHDYDTWHEYNKRLLVRMFNSTSEAEGYRRSEVTLFVDPSTFSDQLETYRSGVADDVRRLRSLVEQLELIPVAVDVQTTDQFPEAIAEQSDRKVFVVHGHDGEAKETVARFLERLGLEAIVLAEQVSAGRTLIEKFEHFSDAAYAVVLMTPDDLGATSGAIDRVARDEAEGDLLDVLAARARQNVVFELGFFYGRLGRKRVCALLAGDVEWPSDIHGVVYVSMRGDWRLTLARELREAGLRVDLNRAI